jgi:hypothetical protein
MKTELFQITADDETMAKFHRFLAAMELHCAHNHSAMMAMFVDGKEGGKFESMRAATHDSGLELQPLSQLGDPVFHAQVAAVANHGEFVGEVAIDQFIAWDGPGIQNGELQIRHTVITEQGAFRADSTLGDLKKAWTLNGDPIPRALCKMYLPARDSKPDSWAVRSHQVYPILEEKETTYTVIGDDGNLVEVAKLYFWHPFLREGERYPRFTFDQIFRNLTFEASPLPGVIPWKCDDCGEPGIKSNGPEGYCQQHWPATALVGRRE